MRKLSTRNYSQDARDRLADAHRKARHAAGYPKRPAYVAAAPGVNLRSLADLESGKPVGEAILFAIGRFLPNWTEDTPQIILEGGPVPELASATDVEDPVDGEPDDERLDRIIEKLDRMQRDNEQLRSELESLRDQRQRGQA